jgi:hypothetical protein
MFRTISSGRILLATIMSFPLLAWQQGNPFNSDLLNAASSPQLTTAMGLEVTRDMQLADLTREPSWAGTLRKALLEVAGQPPDTTPWGKGIVLSPLALVWPGTATVAPLLGSASLGSRSVTFNKANPLPSPGKDYVQVCSLAENTPLLNIQCQFPKDGFYLVSVNLGSIFATPERPRLLDPSNSPVPLAMAPNDPVKPTRWTALVKVVASSPAGLSRGFGILPSKAGASGSLGFNLALTGKVTIRRL